MKDKRRVTAFVVIAAALLVAAGGLMASNMGFKLNYPVKASSDPNSNSGRNAVGLPYNRQVGIDTAKQFLDDVSASGLQGLQLEKFDPATDTNAPYPGPAGDFALAASEGYLLRVNVSGDYIIVGSHDPGFTVTLNGTSTSNSGRTRYSHPYHGVAATAAELLAETGGIQLEKFDPATDTNAPYPGPAGDFALVPGEAYLIRVIGANTQFVPAHY